jgi:hypothetical protein
LLCRKNPEVFVHPLPAAPMLIRFLIVTLLSFQVGCGQSNPTLVKAELDDAVQ